AVIVNVEQAASALNIGSAAGAGGLSKIGPGSMSVTNLAASGGLNVNAGTFAVTAGGSLSGTPTISIASGAHLDVSAAASFSTPAGTTIAGNGLVHGNYTHGAGTIAPGSSAGTLTFANDLNLTNGGTLLFDLSSSSTTAGSGVNDLIAVQGNL